MTFDKFVSPEELSAQRRGAMAQSIRVIPAEELKSLGEKLFPQADHPWREAYFAFLSEHKSATVHHAVTSDGVNLLYCRDQDKGIWFLPGEGLGPLAENGRNSMKKLIDPH
jgi:hypothetical protein